MTLRSVPPPPPSQPTAMPRPGPAKAPRLPQHLLVLPRRQRTQLLALLDDLADRAA